MRREGAVFVGGRSARLDHYLLRLQGTADNMDTDSMKTIRNCRINSRILGFLLIIILITGLILIKNFHFRNSGRRWRPVNLVPVEKCTGSKCVQSNDTSAGMKYALYFQLRKTKVNKFIYRFMNQPKDVCDPFYPPALMILVPSSPSHVEERKAIRATWGSVSHGGKWPLQSIKGKAKLVFLLGIIENITTLQTIQDEVTEYNDIVQCDFLDTYQNLSLKILSGIRWTYLNCPDVKFILKADDDTFVHLPLLIATLEGYYHKVDRNGVIFGNINGDAKVRRRGMWKVSENNYPFPHFPPYAYGNTYVISANIASRIFSASEYMPYIPIEDAYITGILAKVIDARHVYIPGFTFWLDYKPNYCDFVNDNRISATKVNFKYMYYLWEKIRSEETDC